jgi:hypothetical protein
MHGVNKCRIFEERSLIPKMFQKLSRLLRGWSGHRKALSQLRPVSQQFISAKYVPVMALRHTRELASNITAAAALGHFFCGSA